MITTETTSQAPNFDQRLLTEEAIRQLCKPGTRSLRVAARTIITPLAQDFIQENKIAIERMARDAAPVAQPGISQGSSKVGLLANCSQTAANAVQDILREFGFETIAVKPVYPTPGAVDSAMLNLAGQIAGAGLRAAIIIDENAFALKRRAEKIDGVRPIMCWNVVSECGCDRATNLLFVNIRLLGFRKLRQIVRAWLEAINPEARQETAE